MLKTYRPCPMFRPDFVVDVDDQAATIRFHSDASGFEAVFSTSSHKLVSHVRQSKRIPIAPALEFESRFVRRSTPPSILMSGDVHDTTKAGGTTGGGRRSFIAVAGERAVLGKQDGFDALYTWSVDQGQRPLAHWPYRFTYDGYFGKLTASGWGGTTPAPDGWENFRADHLESASLFFGAGLGEDMALAQFLLLLTWVSGSFYDAKNGRLQQGWHGSRQARAMGWVPWFMARASLLGLDSAEAAFITDFLGVPPKVLLRALVDDLVRRPPRLGENKPDDRTMVDFRDGSGEVRADYPWQWAIYFAAIGYLRRSGLLTSAKWETLQVLARASADDLWERAIGTGGVSYSVSATATFLQADCDKANQLETDKTHVYELVDGVIREIPRKPDAELTAAAIAMLAEPSDPRCKQLLALLPAPSNMQKYDDMARYLDPALALLEQGG